MGLGIAKQVAGIALGVLLILSTFALLSSTITSFQFITPALGQQPEEALKCYRIKSGIDPDPVVLEDQFGIETVDPFLGPEANPLFCVLALKHSETAPESPLHWKLDFIIGEIDPPEVQLKDQFNTSPVTVVPFSAAFLAVPTLKNGEGDLTAPHFKGYPIFEFLSPEPVMVTDQFGTETVDIRDPPLLLVPALKNGEGDLDAPTWKCYVIVTDPLTLIDPPEVVLEHQFGIETVDPKPAELLCVMAKLSSPPPASPPFSQPINSIFPNAQQSITCLQGHFDPSVPKHFWFYQSKVTGSATIDVKAVSVNPTGESGSIKATLFGPGLPPSGISVQVFHPTGSPPAVNPGDENTGSITITNAAVGNIYRLEVELGPPTVQGTMQAHHYKVTSSDSLFSVGVNSPTHRYSEGIGQPEVYQVNLGAGETSTLKIFTESPDFGAPQATSVTVTIKNRSTLTTVFGPTTFALGAAPASQLITLTNPSSSSPGQLVLYISADHHYRMDKTSGTDRGIYYDTCPPAPQLTVIKTVTNDNGGQAAPADFNISVTGNSPAPSNFPGSPTGTVVTLKAGQYGVTETGPNGYSSIFSTDCSGTIDFGDTKTCTITNNDIAPTLTVTKIVVNDNGRTLEFDDFPLFIDGNAVTNGVANTLNAGTHTVSETNQAGYTATIGGACLADGTITLNVGENKVCTITNDDIPLTGTATRTQGFWSTHFNLAQQTWLAIDEDDRIIGSKNMGDGSNDVSEMMGGFWSDISKKTDGSKRSALDQARMQLVQQLLAAMLNKQAFDTNDNGAIAAGNAAFAGNDINAILSAKNALEAYNLSGDTQPLPTSVNAGSASPQTSRSNADKAFWNMLP